MDCGSGARREEERKAEREARFFSKLQSEQSSVAASQRQAAARGEAQFGLHTTESHASLHSTASARHLLQHRQRQQQQQRLLYQQQQQQVAAAEARRKDLVAQHERYRRQVGEKAYLEWLHKEQAKRAAAAAAAAATASPYGLNASSAQSLRAAQLQQQQQLLYQAQLQAYYQQQQQWQAQVAASVRGMSVAGSVTGGMAGSPSSRQFMSPHSGGSTPSATHHRTTPSR